MRSLLRKAEEDKEIDIYQYVKGIIGVDSLERNLGNSKLGWNVYDYILDR